MQIENHKLFYETEQQVRFTTTPNKSLNKKLNPRFLVIHWTGNDSFKGAINWLTSPEAKASAHLVVSRTGDICQMANLNEVTWHIGESKHLGLVSLNQYSIGIEVVCCGQLQKQKDGTFISWNKKIIPVDEVVEIKKKYYHSFSKEQHIAIKSICKAAIAAYPTIEQILSHKDLAWPVGRKSDCPDELYGKEKLNSELLGL